MILTIKLVPRYARRYIDKETGQKEIEESELGCLIEHQIQYSLGKWQQNQHKLLYNMKIICNFQILELLKLLQIYKPFSHACFHYFSNLLIKMKITANKRHLQYLQQKENSSKHFRKRRKIQNLRSLTFINKFSNSQNYNLLIHFTNSPKQNDWPEGGEPSSAEVFQRGEEIKNACPEGFGSSLSQRAQAPRVQKSQ